MKRALVDAAGRVVNHIVVDDPEAYPLPEGWRLDDPLAFPLEGRTEPRVVPQPAEG